MTGAATMTHPMVPVDPSLPAPDSLGAWVMAARPKTLVAGWAPVAVGSSMAAFAMSGGRSFSVIRALAALAVAVLIQVSTNFVNDAADHARGADTPERLGPPRAVALGLLSGRSLMRAGIACSAIAGVIGLWLASVSSWWLLVPGGLALVAGVAYTAGPKPLAYLGLGEIFVFLFFGLFATMGSYLVQPGVRTDGFWMFIVLGAGVSIGAMSVAIIEVNNIRDAPQDAKVGKATLAVRLGEGRSRQLLLASLALAYISWSIAVWPAVVFGGLFFLLPLLTLLKAEKIRLQVRAGVTGSEWNRILGAVARLMTTFALLAALGPLLQVALSVVRR